MRYHQFGKLERHESLLYLDCEIHAWVNGAQDVKCASSRKWSNLNRSI